MPALRAFLIYLLVAVLLIGGHVLGHFGSTSVGYGPDPAPSMWVLKWWPQAIFDGINPLHIPVAYAPDGLDATMITSTPAPSMILAPLTQTAGPLVSYNVFSILIPAIDAWAAFLLCRALGSRYWPSVAGGYVFGFSTYVLGHSLAHPPLSLVAAIPLALYLAIRLLRKQIGRGAFVACLTALLTLEFLTSTEIFLTMTMFAVAASGLALLLLPERRRSLLDAGALVLVAYAIAGLLVAPYLISALSASQLLQHVNPIYYAADPLNLVVPTRLTVGGSALGSINGQFTGNLAENGTYIGIPLLIVLGSFAWQRRRSRAALLLLAMFAISLVAALGPRLDVLGTASGIRLPWTPFLHLPFVKYVLPVRLTVYAWLALAIVVALWLSTASRRQWAKWALVAVGLVSILPDPWAVDPSPPHYGASIWSTRQPLPALFRSGSRPLFRGRPNLLVLPYNEAGDGASVYWQANTGMAFAMPGGYLSGTVPENFACWPLVGRLRAEEYDRADRGELLAFLAAKQVDGVVAPVGVGRRAAPLLGALGAPRRTEGVLVYSVPKMHEAAPCPNPS